MIAAVVAVLGGFPLLQSVPGLAGNSQGDWEEEIEISCLEQPS